MTIIRDKSLTVIVGLGKTGLSCAHFLAERNRPFAVMDNREKPPELENFVKAYPHIKLVRGQFSEELLNKACEIVLSPGVSLQEPIIERYVAMGKSIIGDIELFARTTTESIIAITGSNGKTTVTALVELMIKAAGKNAAVCGNIGQPVLSQITSKIDYYVLELSSFQLETTFSLRPMVATILNISEDHMNRYACLEDYRRAKQRIYMGCRIAIINTDAPETWNNLSFDKNPLSFGINNQADFSLIKRYQKNFISYRNQILMSVEELKLNARHHVQNALAALALGKAVGVSIEIMLQVLREFSGIRHRCQWVRRLCKVDYYNDSKGTNVGATQAAIESLGKIAQGRIILIAGGQGKGANFSSLKEPVKHYVKQVILIGEDASLLEQTLKGITFIKYAYSMSEAVKRSAKAAQSGDIVLLSPACASFDMFINYEHRGDVFIEMVEAL